MLKAYHEAPSSTTTNIMLPAVWWGCACARQQVWSMVSVLDGSTNIAASLNDATIGSPYGSR